MRRWKGYWIFRLIANLRDALVWSRESLVRVSGVRFQVSGKTLAVFEIVSVISFSYAYKDRKAEIVGAET